MAIVRIYMKDDDDSGGGGGLVAGGKNPIDTLVDSYQKKTGGDTSAAAPAPATPTSGPSLAEAAPGLGAIPSALVKIPGQMAEGLGLTKMWDTAKETVVQAADKLVTSATGQIGAQVSSPTYGTPPSDLFARDQRRASLPAMGLPGAADAAAPPVVPTTGNAPVRTSLTAPSKGREEAESLGLPGTATAPAAAPAAAAPPVTSSEEETTAAAKKAPPVIEKGWEVMPGKGAGDQLMISKKEMITLPDGTKIPKLSVKPVEGTWSKDVAERQQQESEARHLDDIMDLAKRGERLNQDQKTKAFEWADTVMSNILKGNLTGQQAQDAIHIVNQLGSIAAGHGGGGGTMASQAQGLLSKSAARRDKEEQAQLTREDRAINQKNRREDKQAEEKRKAEDAEAARAATRITSFTRHISSQKNAFGETRSPASVLVDMLKANQPIPKEFGPSVEGMVKMIRARIAYKELELKRKLNYDERNAIFDSYRDELDRAAR